ncbi:MAG: alpha/beta fold hydrolase [bacterium]
MLGLAGAATATALYFSLKSDISRDRVQQNYTNDDSEFISFRGLDVHYRITGTGPALVLLHGTASSLHTWDGWTDVLSDHYRVIRMDLPGFGLTGPDPQSRYTLDSYVAFLNHFLDELDVQSAHLAGNSFGGKIAWNYTAEHPDRIEKMILINSMGFMTHWPSLFRLPGIPIAGHALKYLSPRWVIRRFLRSLYGQPDTLKEDVFNRYFDLLLAEGNRRALYERLNAPIARNEDKLTHIKTPTLVQWGTLDPLLPVNHANGFNRKLPRSSLLTYLGLGHVPMEESPEQTARNAHQFLQG